ncbi:MAG TPA: heme-binding protein [Silvibacterium sp.]|nr:heme-binding protein [Silvibacterium sp.]
MPASSEKQPSEGLPSHGDLRAALIAAVSADGGNGGFGLNMWATIVDRDGIVRTVVFSGNDRGDQWPGSRVISAQKANTANSLSLPKLALSTAQLYSAVQPGGSLFGLQFSNPVNTEVAYAGDAKNYGQENDPMIGGKIGGVNVFGGGLALYNSQGVLVGGLGVSGDSSCADHNIAWRVRHSLNLDFVPGGVGSDSARPDNIIYDITAAPGLALGVSTSGWGHPVCSEAAKTISGQLPAVQ